MTGRYAAARLVVAFLVGWAAGGAAQAQDNVDLKIVKFDGLKEAVSRQRGKVVLVDFWGEF